MKRLRNILFYVCIIVLFGSYQAVDEGDYNYVPLLMTREVLESSVTLMPAKELANPGKIYLMGDYIFINERYKGIHIVNNSDPENPHNIHFIRIPGCIDMAVKGQTLYADNAVDLIAVDLSDINSISVTERIRNVFPELQPPDNNLYYRYSKENRPENTIIVGWEPK